ncbi:MAG: Gfo/Idh/MocA family oxidoreductase [Candidatus Omnitrophica bacterium]|nr:Gfo/Idh/MocA family oxidoreductase [Candidatus Omnitrophota bacterium]
MAVRIGFIGVGGIAHSHLSRLSQIKEAEIVALCDVVRGKAEDAAKKYQATSYTNYKEMLDKENLDAVFICLPPFAHGDIEIDLAQRGIPFFIEKPVNLHLEKARKVEKIVKEKNLITSAGYVLRYMDIVEKARDFLQDKKIALVLGRYFGEFPKSPWLGVKEKSGGQIVEQATHIVDLMRYLAGEIDYLYGQGFSGLNKLEDYNVEDASIVAFHFEKGALGSLTSNWLLSGFQPTLEIVTKGIQIQYSVTSLKIISKDKKEEFQVNNDYALLEDQIFIEAVGNNAPSKIKSDYSDALRTLEVTLAANESMEKKRIISL